MVLVKSLTESTKHPSKGGVLYTSTVNCLGTQLADVSPQVSQ